jgi:hypothetical protein
VSVLPLAFVRTPGVESVLNKIRVLSRQRHDLGARIEVLASPPKRTVSERLPPSVNLSLQSLNVPSLAVRVAAR